MAPISDARALAEMEQLAAQADQAEYKFAPKYDKRTLYTDIVVPLTREMVQESPIKVTGEARWTERILFRARARFGVAMTGGNGGSSVRVIEQYEIQYSVDGGRVWGTAMVCYTQGDGRDRMRAGFDEMMVSDLLVNISDGAWYGIRHLTLMDYWQDALEMAEEAHDIQWRI